MKKISTRNMAIIKRVAQNVNKSVMDKEKALAKMSELQKIVEEAQNFIDANEAGIKGITGGYTSEDLVKKVVETTDKVDKKGTPIKVTKYVPTDLVEYNEDEKCYYVKDINLDEIPTEEIDNEEKAPDNMVASTEDFMAETL